MQTNQTLEAGALSRRNFIKSSTLAAAAATVSFPSILHAQGKMTINAVVIGVGGRGSGAGSGHHKRLPHLPISTSPKAIRG